MEITRWERTDWWKTKPSVNELTRIHHHLHRHDKFAQVMYSYPFGKDIMANTIKELIPRTNYEFFLARLQESKEIMGWIGLSFDDMGNGGEHRVEYEARLEWTQMCSHILKGWQADSAGGKSHAWDMMKRASSRLQAQHLPRDYCIINTLVVLPEFQRTSVPNSLLLHAIDFWKKRVEVGTEWAMWVQAPPFTQNLYRRYGFEDVGEYEVDLGDYGFLPKEEREVSGKYNWKFMVRREASGSAIGEPDGAREPDQDKGKEQEPEDVEEHAAAEKQGKGKSQEQQPEDVEEFVGERDRGKGKEQGLDDLQADENIHPARGDPSEYDAERTRSWEEAEERIKDIHFRRGPSPLPGEVACLLRIQRDAEARGADTTGHSRGKGVEQRSQDVRAAPLGEPSARPSRWNDEVVGQLQDNYIPSGSEEDLIEAMRKGGVDEEEIELVRSLAFSMSDEARGE